MEDGDTSDETVQVTATASGGDYEGETAEVAVTVTDDETAGLVVDPAMLPLTRGRNGDVHGEAGDAADGAR